MPLIDCPANKILENPGLHLWEDISESYWVLRTASFASGGLILFYDNYSSPEEMDYARRYIQIFNIKNVIFSPVIYNKENLFMCIENYAELLSLIQSEKYSVLKYRSQKMIYVEEAPYKVIPVLNQLAIALELPNFRFRCEEFYLYYKQNPEKLNYIYNLLQDDESRGTLVEILRAAAENDLYRLPESTSIMKYFDCYRHKEDEIWINCGSCYGDTISNFLYHGYSFKKIFSIEGDNKYFSQLIKNLDNLPEEFKNKIKLFNLYIGENGSKYSFDNLFKFTPISLINMDIEGFEMRALEGAREIIGKYRPVLAICTYHKSQDLYDIPKFIESVTEGYRFFIRKYTTWGGNSFNEFLYYCVPEERLL